MPDIPVKNTVPLVSIVATAGQTVFSFPFLVFASDQLKVERLPVGASETIPLVETTDYTVAGVDDPDGGTITLTAGSFPTGATLDEQFTLFRDIPIERLTDFPFRGGFSSEVINKELDTNTLILQEQARDISRTLRLQPADALTEAVLPLGRENLFLAFDATGVPIPAAGTSANLGPVSAFMDTLLPALDAAAARTILDAASRTAGNIFTGRTQLDGDFQQEQRAATAAASLVLGPGSIFDMSGNAAITSIGTKGVGSIIYLVASGFPSLVSHPTDLVTPADQDILMSPGDVAALEEYATGDWRVIGFLPRSINVGVVSIVDPPGELANGTDAAHEIDITGGTWRAEDKPANIILPATTIDIENAGNGGRLDSETLDASTWYHVLSGRNTSDSAFVAGFKKTIAKPADWDFYRRLGSVLTDGSSNIVAFEQKGDLFLWNVPVNDYSVTTPGTAGQLRGLTVPPASGIEAKHTSSLFANTSAAPRIHVLITHPAQADTVPTANVKTFSIQQNTITNTEGSIHSFFRTNASGQIRVRLSASNAGITTTGTTHGWRDQRGRNG